jgi:glycosyltransferase involved in cell wall biosynthesis
VRVSYISWAAYCSRSDHTARELQGTSHMVYWEKLGSRPATVWLKYIGQAISTLRILLRERPDAVFVMAPPLFAVLAVYSYCAIAHIPFVIDTHTAAILHPRWKRLQWLHHVMSRRAATSIVTNEHLARVVQNAGGHATIVRDVPIVFKATTEFPRVATFSVAVVCSFNYDEPIEAILDAAAEVPDVQFYMTGNPRNLRTDLSTRIPANVKLTGFLSDAEYGALLTYTDVVMTLTTRDHTMLRGAYEAIYQGTPVIVSDWPLLRAAFDTGALHVDNTAHQIASAVREMQASHERFKAGASELRDRKLLEWKERRQVLLQRLQAARA